MPQRLRQLLLTGSMLWLSWLAMMLVHECGHMLGAIGTGGTVTRLVWFPTVLSRTDVTPNPHPLVEVWAGPVVGSLVPASLAGLLVGLRAKAAYLFLFFAGFCLIANGAYIGLGAEWPVGDAKVLVTHGTPRLLLALFGVITIPTGFLLWDKVSPRFGFGVSPDSVSTKHVLAALCVAAILTAACWLGGRRGV